VVCKVVRAATLVSHGLRLGGTPCPTTPPISRGSTAIDEEIHPTENPQRAGFEPIPLTSNDGTELLGAIVNPRDYELVRLTWGGAPFLFDAARTSGHGRLSRAGHCDGEDDQLLLLAREPRRLEGQLALAEATSRKLTVDLQQTIALQDTDDSGAPKAQTR
jgi:hypothetical protein